MQGGFLQRRAVQAVELERVAPDIAAAQAAATATTEELHRGHRHVEVGDALEVGGEAVDHLLHRDVAIVRPIAQRLEVDEQVRAVAAVDDGGYVQHRRVGLEHRGHLA